jgi:hypothetical protein
MDVTVVRATVAGINIEVNYQTNNC